MAPALPDVAFMSKIRDAVRKPYWEMTTEELREATRRYDRPNVHSYPLTAEDKALQRRAKRRKPGRPRVGKGAARVPVNLERGLLKRIDAYAKRNGVSRSQVLARGAEKVIAESALS